MPPPPALAKKKQAARRPEQAEAEIVDTAETFALILMEQLPEGNPIVDETQSEVAFRVFESLFDAVGRTENLTTPEVVAEIKEALETKQFASSLVTYTRLSDRHQGGAEFLSRLITKSGKIVTFGDLMFLRNKGLLTEEEVNDELCRDLATQNLKDAFEMSGNHPDQLFSSNLTTQKLDTPTIMEDLLELRQKHAPGPLPCLEVVEKIESEDHISKIVAIHNLGYPLALDDCGDGNSEALYKRLTKEKVVFETYKIGARIVQDIQQGKIQEAQKWAQRAKKHGANMIFEGGGYVQNSEWIPVNITEDTVTTLTKFTESEGVLENSLFQGPVV